ncbi:hypothetical protein [Phytoactinopolyspora mesophila]|uniref:Uncharacterized protein n=1 Tax=Phytoactinopolyspora mesophila TaxID=2650750 RepID=A0A7K3M5J9_9ACTN|nr:hypothetical protein [Phytoactinopolyspora mesophila]NDL58599.1 hypothetical protein [Phytoactinopolyspora mesophila]
MPSPWRSILLATVVLVVLLAAVPSASATLSVPAELVIVDPDDAPADPRVPAHVFGVGILVLVVAGGWAIYSKRRDRDL